jgi:2-polyprenyl-6-methoxyphenol hydroxylase-like FAD-dependent oxidoreductase
MKVAVVGAGTAGLATALLLARDGHEVRILERVPDPRPVGAGILLQPLGQRILGELQLAESLAGCSTPVRRIEGTTRRGWPVLRFGYHDGPGEGVGLGVHRGDLFRILREAVDRARIPLHTAAPIRSIHPRLGGWQLEGDPDDEPVDLVVAADGARSTIRRRLGLATLDVGYPFGAIWTVVPDPDRLAGDTLWQRYGGTRVTLGILPTGIGGASIFWTEPARRLDGVVAAGREAWLDRVRPYAGPFRALVERVPEGGLLPARYRDVVVSRPYRLDVSARHAIVLVGDAAHAMSPQLGMGASLALADAWSLASAIRQEPGHLAAALERHHRSRRAHIAWYTWLSRFMTPVFQSDLVPLGWARDMAFPVVARIPWVRRQFATILRGVQTTPWTRWEPTRPGGRLDD